MKPDNYMYKKVSLRTKALMIILPVIVSSLVISNYLAKDAFEKTLNNAGMQFMAYKTGQLRKYADMQWGFLLENKFDKDQVYLNAMRQAVLSYSMGMAEEGSEAVLSVTGDAVIDISTEKLDIKPDEKKELEKIIHEKKEGWVGINLGGQAWVGYVFYYQPLDWYVFILEKKSNFYSMMNKAGRQQTLINALSILISGIVIVIFINYLTNPIKKIADKITSIKSIDDISSEIEIVYPDEIGKLAFEFNKMNRRLVKSYTRLKTIAIREAAANREISLRELETLNVLSRTSDYKDPETGAHIARVAHYSKMLASFLGVDDENLDIIYYASPLHDIGKIGIPDAILLKPAKLTESEFEIIKTHTTIAYNILNNTRSKYLKAGAEIAISHHEKYDGTGYPKGLKGEEIPLPGRIVAIADVFDALTTSRPYKEPWPIGKAVEYMETQYGKHFDPAILKLFLDNLETVKKIYNNNQDLR